MTQIYGYNHGWEDIQGNISWSTGVAAPTLDTYRDAGFSLSCLKHNENDECHMLYQLPHRWNPVSEVRLHLHIVPLSNASGNAYFEVVHYWSNIGVVIPAVASWTTTYVTYAIAASDQYKHKIVSLLTLTPSAGMLESSILLVKMRRLGTNNNDTYDTNKDHGAQQANIGILYMDLHYQGMKSGTQNEIPP